MKKIDKLKQIKNKIIAGTLSATALLSVTACEKDSEKKLTEETTIETVDTLVDDIVTVSPSETTVVITTTITEETDKESKTTPEQSTEIITTSINTSEQVTEMTTSPITTANDAFETSENTTTVAQTTEVSTSQNEEKKYNKLTKDNINDLDYFDHYAEEFYKCYYPEGVFCGYGILGSPYREVFDLKDEFKMFFTMINYEYLDKATIKHALKNLDDWNTAMCLCYSFNISLYSSKRIIPDYDTFCVDDEMSSILSDLANKTKKVNFKTIKDYDEKVMIPFLDGTGEINMNNASPYVYCIYIFAQEKACQISTCDHYHIETLNELFKYIMDNLTKEDIINGKGKTIGQYINN